MAESAGGPAGNVSTSPAQPALYQINTRVWLTGISTSLGRRATLDDVPDAELDRLSGLGFDWVWLLSVWQTGPAARAISRANPEWRREFAATLPDLRDDDIAGIGVHIACRLAETAQPGSIWVSRTVTDLVAGCGLAFAPRGAHRLAGLWPAVY